MQIKSPLSASKQEQLEPKSSSNPVVNVFRKLTGFGSKKADVEEANKSSLVDDHTQDINNKTDNRIPDNYQGDFAAESEESDHPFGAESTKNPMKKGGI